MASIRHQAMSKSMGDSQQKIIEEIPSSKAGCQKTAPLSTSPLKKTDHPDDDNEKKIKEKKSKKLSIEEERKRKEEEGGDEDTTIKVFINVCYSDVINKPGIKKKLDEKTGEEIEGMNIPVSVGPVEPAKDKAGNLSVCIDVIVNDDVISDCRADESGGFR